MISKAGLLPSSISHCGEAGHSNEQITRLSDQSLLYDSSNLNQLLTRTVAIASLTKKAQEQLSQIQDRM